MQFRMTYDGPLYGSSRASPRPDHKHDIRRVFHRQLKRLWQAHPWLKEATFGVYEGFERIPSNSPLWQGLAQRHQLDPYKFVPLVRTKEKLLCSVDLSLLRPDVPGGLIKSADLDSRLKTLFDAFKMPSAIAQLGKYQTPEPDEDPFFCLLEDDMLITHVSVATDMLLEPSRSNLSSNEMKNDARLVIDVKIKPYFVTWGNIGFGS